MKAAWWWVACVLAAVVTPRVSHAQLPPRPETPAPESPASETAVPETPAPAELPPAAPAPVVDRSYDAPVERQTRRREIRIEVPGERSRNNKLALAGALGLGVLGSAVGVYYHLDSRDASREVSADIITGKAWTHTQVDAVERAAQSRTRAAIGYGIGGAFVIGTIVAFIVTEPEAETSVIRTTLVPTRGGAVVAKGWRF